MQHVKDGQLEELSVLFERYHLRLFNFFLKLTSDRAVSQDLTQNLFYRIMKYRTTYRDVHSVKAWIYQVARNVHIDHCRSEQKRNHRFIPVETYNPETREEESRFDEDDYGRLEQALQALTDEQKELIVLSRYQGLKYEEISKICDLSVPAIKTQVHRAMKQLRSIYFKQV